MTYQQVHTTPADHASALGRVCKLLGQLRTRITVWELNVVELQCDDETLRFVRNGSEQVRSDFDSLLEVVARYPHLAAPGVNIPRRVV